MNEDNKSNKISYVDVINNLKFDDNEITDDKFGYNEYKKIIENANYYINRNSKNFEKSLDIIITSCNSYCKKNEIHDSCYNNCMIKGLYAFSNLIYRRKLYDIEEVKK